MMPRIDGSPAKYRNFCGSGISTVTGVSDGRSEVIPGHLWGKKLPDRVSSTAQFSGVFLEAYSWVCFSSSPNGSWS